MKKTVLLLLLASMLNAKYTNCDFQNKDYEDICNKAVKRGVSYKYANEFLLSYFKTQKYDEISWKYLQPRHITKFKNNERKANKVLVNHISKIVKHLKKYKEVYDYSEKTYGVNREIIASILMKETKLGQIKPTHDAFIVFNTIVVRTKAKTKREKWLLKMGKTNMISIIKHCYKKGVTPEQCNLPSSYAGAVGIPQFMPNSFIYTKGYKNKVADLTKMEDAIISASRFLHKKAAYSKLIEWNKMPDIKKLELSWYKFEANNDNASLVYSENKHGKKYECFTCDKENLIYFKEYTKKIMRYNNSSNYAIGVMRLAYDSNKKLDRK
ncbi:lytic murein transglycosylase [Sulfurimonas sp.]|uniref:lytic murein transglycosylase n=1 Tax=Sulfurimonas sp. TaxID=2022749 RepID=UPI002B47E799|nr:lytic murein transglycosylase [Sulfurimonas sp.]